MRVARRIFVIVVLVLVAVSTCSVSQAATKPPSKKTCETTLSSQPLPQIKPIILKPLKSLKDNPNHLFEMKYDGFRAIAYFDRQRGCRFISRNGKRLPQFQDLCEAIASELKIKNAIFDGEIIATDESGRPIFKKLLRREGPFQYVAFDLLWLNGQDFRELPLEERRQKLLKVLPKSSKIISESLAQVGTGSKLFNLMVEHDLEGIVVKRLKDKYLRSTKWYKVKNPNYSQNVGRKWR